MENLSDAEFGSDKNTEEAPILVAQRYLNIFRQIHIFNKDKRDQFDDELLALPQNIQDYFKKMPGGRLLVEHIEDVKTERGISFEKSNKDDFTNGMDGTSGATPESVVPQFAGGNLVMDSSFAETFASTLANAFKDAPLPSASIAPISGATISADFGNAFNVIAEEIHASKASLLEVLRETKYITDSVIASQVTISRILEGFLSSRQSAANQNVTFNEASALDQNNSLALLIENLYAENAKKNSEISAHLDVERQLQDFRNEINQTIHNSLQQKERSSTVSYSDVDIEQRLSLFKSEIKSELDTTLHKIQNLLDGKQVVSNIAHDVSNNNTSTQSFASVSESPVVSGFISENEENFEIKKKKKKKKKNKHLSEGVALTSEDSSFEATDFDDNSLDEPDVLSTDTLSENTSTVQGVIHNTQYKQLDDFDNIHLDEPPLDFDSNQNDSSLDDFMDKPNSDEDYSLTHSVDDTDFSESPEPSFNETNEDDLSFSGDFADDTLADPKEDNIEEELLDDIDLKFADSLSEDIVQSDGLDFALPDAPFAEENEEDTNIDNLSSIHSADPIDEDGLDFALPGDVSSTKEDDIFSDDSDNPSIGQENSDTQNLDDVLLSDFPEENLSQDVSDDENYISPVENETEASIEPINTLDEADYSENDDALSLDNLDSVTDQEAEIIPQDEVPLDDNISLDEQSSDLIDESSDGDLEKIEAEDISDSAQNKENTPSRYSAELEKIRAALTSDSVDLASLETPIALDDYSDDENIPVDENLSSEASATDDSSNEDDNWEYEYVEDDTASSDENSVPNENENTSDSNEDWEWEYVDDDGNITTDSQENNNEDWEWEYVEEDDDNTSKDENADKV